MRTYGWQRFLKIATLSIFLLLQQWTSGKQCPFRTQNLVLFNTIPQEGETLPGKCISNAEQEPNDESLTLSCYADGNYTTTGQCMCSPGFYLNNRLKCIECEDGHTKSDIGNDRCIFQGYNTIKCVSTTRLCPCKDKFFRVTEEQYLPGTNCYEAGQVRRIYYSNNTDGSVIIKWKSPFNKPGYQPIFFVSTNNGPYQRKTSRTLFFPKSNHTRNYNIKIITEVKVGDKIHRGGTFTTTFTVHKTKHSAGNTVRAFGTLTYFLVLSLNSIFFNFLLLR